MPRVTVGVVTVPDDGITMSRVFSGQDQVTGGGQVDAAAVTAVSPPASMSQLSVGDLSVSAQESDVACFRNGGCSTVIALGIVTPVSQL